MSSPCVSRGNRHRHTLIRRRSRYDRTNPRSHRPPLAGSPTMGQVSASSTVVIDAEPETMFGGSRGITRPSAGRSSPRSTATTGCSRRTACRHRGDGEAAGDQIACARRQGERRRGRAHGYRKGRQLDDGDQLDRRARRARLIGHGQDVVAGRRRHRRVLREDVRAVGLAEDSGRGAGKTSRSKSRAGKRPDIDDRGLEDLAARSSEAARDTATTASAYF
jgi:hypothetical protein